VNMATAGDDSDTRPLLAQTARSLAHRLAGATLLIGLGLSTVMVALQSWVSYNAELELTRQRLDGLAETMAPGLARSLWYVDQAQIDVLLDGVAQVPGVEYVRLDSSEGERRERGTALDAPLLSRDYPLRYTDGESFAVGTLRVEVGERRIDARLRGQILRQAVVITALLLGTSFLILLLFRQWVTRHLGRMADYTHELSFDRLAEGAPLVLVDKPVRDPPDELDQVTAAMNRMRERMIQFMQMRGAYEQALEEHRSRLESLVEERTAELSRKAALLEDAARAAAAARTEAARNETRLRLITDNVPALISRIGTDRRFLFNNKAYSRWLERPLAQITGQRLEDVYTPEQFRQIAPHLDAAFAGERVTFEMYTGRRYVRATYVPEIDPDGQVESVYGLAHDITQIKQVEEELRKLAQFDPLTGLANRRRFEERMHEAIARSERSGQTLALMFLDLDRFKQINDSLGHKTGDRVLQEFAARLVASVRQTDTVARLAGDEFVVVLEHLRPDSARDEAESLAAKILAAMVPALRVDDASLTFSTSIGIALRAPGETDAAALLQRADAALYAAKHAGRGTWRFNGD